MNISQKRIFFLYFLSSILLAVGDHLYPALPIIRYGKFFFIASLFLLALSFRKSFREQVLLTFALFFVTLGDSMFILSNTLRSYHQLVAPLGGFSFLLAYLILISLFQKGRSFDRRHILVLIPVLIVYLPVFILCYPFVTGLKYLAVFTFSLFLCYMAWRALCSVFEKYYTAKIIRCMAGAGYLILISDLAVGLAVFYPPCSGIFSPWLENIIWVPFIMAWTLITVITAEKESIFANKALEL